MAQIEMRKISNAAVHVNGVAIIGTIMEVGIPEVKPTTMDFKALGMLGTTEIPTGMDKMEGNIKLNAIATNVVEAFGNVFTPINLMVRSNVESYSSTSTTLKVPGVWTMTAFSKGVPSGTTLKASEAAEFSVDFSVMAITYEEDGVELLHFDATNNQYRVNGVDKAATYRANIGQ